jgi:hypothetical protein
MHSVEKFAHFSISHPIIAGEKTAPFGTARAESESTYAVRVAPSGANQRSPHRAEICAGVRSVCGPSNVQPIQCSARTAPNRTGNLHTWLSTVARSRKTVCFVQCRGAKTKGRRKGMNWMRPPPLALSDRRRTKRRQPALTVGRNEESIPPHRLPYRIIICVDDDNAGFCFLAPRAKRGRQVGARLVRGEAYNARMCIRCEDIDTHAVDIGSDSAVFDHRRNRVCIVIDQK